MSIYSKGVVMDKIGHQEQIDVVKRTSRQVELEARITESTQEMADLEVARAETVAAVRKAYAAVTQTEEWRAWNALSRRIASLDSMAGAHRKAIKRARQEIGLLKKETNG
jgi:hypothetical protein